jgi:phage-related protein
MRREPVPHVDFFRTEAGREPVRDWLLDLEPEDRKTIGEDIKLVQFRWPLGMSFVRKLEAELWEVRSRLSGGRISRAMFIVRRSEMVLLHAFLKKQQKTPEHDLETARSRKKLWLGNQPE